MSYSLSGSKVVFTYDVDALFEKVYRATSYIARNVRDSNGKYELEGVVMTPEDKAVFTDLLDNEAAHIYEPFLQFTTADNDYYSLSGSTLTINIYLPPVYRSEMFPLIEKNIGQALTSGVILRWFKLVSANRLGNAYAQVVQDATDAYNKLVEFNLFKLR